MKAADRERAIDALREAAQDVRALAERIPEGKVYKTAGDSVILAIDLEALREAAHAGRP